MLDIEGAVAVRIVCALQRRENPPDVVRVHVADDLRNGHRLVGIPAVHVPQLERPEDHIGRVVVIEDPDISDADRLAEPLIIVLHERARFISGHTRFAYWSVAVVSKILRCTVTVELRVAQAAERTPVAPGRTIASTRTMRSRRSTDMVSPGLAHPIVTAKPIAVG